MTTDPATAEDASKPANPVGTGHPSAPATGRKPKKSATARTTAAPDPAGDADKPKKSTEAEVSQRVEEILRIRIDGAQFHDVREYAGKMGWGVSDSMLRKYIEKANKLLKEQTERSRSHLLRLHRARREALYARALQAADFRTALACLSDEAKLIGLYPKDKPGPTTASRTPCRSSPSGPTTMTPHPPPRTDRPTRPFDLRGNNGRAFKDRTSKECLVSGAAGTGKSVACMLKLLHFGCTYPKARLLMVRKTRHSLTQSGLVTWEEQILGGSHPIIGRPIDRGHRFQYRFPNGSVLVTGGMDKPDKVLSTEWDMIYAQEATELTVTDWEQLGGRLRAGAGPFDQIIGDCNPTTPTHWLYRRCLQGATKLYETTHKDNPRYFDRAANEWTQAGKRYLDRLGQLTGPRRNRFLKGLWVAAEGLVYDAFDPAVHLLPRGWEPPTNWPRYWAIDWGFIDPLVILFAAVDPQGRLHLYREFYKTRTRVETVAKWCREMVNSGREPMPSAVFADHDPECVATFRQHSGLPVRQADKGTIDKGIQLVQGLFDVRADGQPAIYLRPDARGHDADAELESSGRPTSLIDELGCYQWDTSNPDRPKDEPLDRDNHGADCLRYLARGVRRGGGAVLATGDRSTTNWKNTEF